MVIQKEINPRFENFIFDWNYMYYLLVGAYGSSKSYNIAFKIILKCLQEQRKVLVIREVYDTMRESCYDLLVEILDSMNLLEENPQRRNSKKVICTGSPMRIKFPNGSTIIFKGMDKPWKLKSINGVSIVWMEEASEVKYAGFKEVLGRVRHPSLSLHFILSTNPVDSWVFKHYFESKNDDGETVVILDHKELYKKHTIVKNGVYYHHSMPEDNLFLPASYLKTLEDMKNYDPDLYRVARMGQFGINGRKVLPQFTVAASHKEVISAIHNIPKEYFFCGMDFGFEESYNAIIKMAVDHENKTLYIYKEYYKNHMTDDETADELIEAGGWIDTEISADHEDPKAIRYYQKRGFKMRKCKKYTRMEQVRRCKRFYKIVCSPDCHNTISELATLTYKQDSKGDYIYDEFNIDPHTFSAIWYGLDSYEVVDIKQRKNNSRGAKRAA